LNRKILTLSILPIFISILKGQGRAFLAVPFLFKRPTAFRWFAAGSGALAVYSVGLVGLSGALDYTRVILEIAQNTFGAAQSSMFDLLGALTRLFPETSPTVIRGIIWSLFALAALFLSVQWARNSHIDLRQASIAILVGVGCYSPLRYIAIYVIMVALMCHFFARMRTPMSRASRLDEREGKMTGTSPPNAASLDARPSLPTGGVPG
jgi:hypothetical protein